MGRVIKISDAATIALHTMVLLGANREGVLSTKDIAETLGVSGAHLAKVLQRLTKAGLVSATRGPRGGFMLRKKADEITLLEVFETVEGVLEDTGCLLHDPICSGNGQCMFGGVLKRMDEMIRAQMAETSVADVAPNLRALAAEISTN